jgi:hypothetical protein
MVTRCGKEIIFDLLGPRGAGSELALRGCAELPEEIETR